MHKCKLVVNHLSKRFLLSDKTLLPVISDVSLNINAGEFVSIVGPTGCGKSTLFQILSGITLSDSGTILIDGKIVEERKGNFGYMFQQHLLLPWRTAEGNIMLGMEIKGMQKEKARKRAQELLATSKLAQFGKFYPKFLSGGMKQRIALLRTIALNYSILLLDEPFGSLDALTRLELQQYLLSICRKFRLTVLFITHDIAEAILLSDRIYVLSPRPATIRKVISVSLPKRRKVEHLTSPAAVEIERELLALLVKKENI